MTYLQGGEGGVWHSPLGPPSLGSTTGKSAIFMRRRVGFQDFLTEGEKKRHRCFESRVHPTGLSLELSIFVK